MTSHKVMRAGHVVSALMTARGVGSRLWSAIPIEPLSQHFVDGDGAAISAAHPRDAVRPLGSTGTYLSEQLYPAVRLLTAG